MTSHKPGNAPDVSPYLVVKDASATIVFATSVLGASVDGGVMNRSDGRIWHAELRIGDSTIMIGDSPDGEWQQPGFLHCYVPDADATYAKAIEAGAEPFMPPEDQFYGHRAGGVKDANGTIWWFATMMEETTFEERQRRALEVEKKRNASN